MNRKNPLERLLTWNRCVAGAVFCGPIVTASAALLREASRGESPSE